MLSFYLPILTYPSPSSPGAMQRAIDLVATLEGELTVEAGEVDIKDVANVVADALIDVSGMIASAEAMSKARAEELTEVATSAADRVGVKVTQRHRRANLELMAQGFAIAGRTFDYALVSGTGEEQDELAEAMLFGSGGPIILMPDGETAVTWR